MPITKKHKSILFSGIALMAGATLLAGCSADPLPVSKSEQYTRDFIKTFGAFDQSHDWNHATRATVTVTTPAPTEVKIMADFEGKRYIFATYTNVEGTKTLNVDIPKGISDLIVAANGKNYSVKAGGEVSLTGRGSRAMAGEEPDYITVEVAPEDKWITKPVEYICKYDEILPEKKTNIGRENVSVNFKFKSDGEPFIIYPVMWNTSQTNTLGIYYTHNGVQYMKDLYTIKGGNNGILSAWNVIPHGWALTSGVSDVDNAAKSIGITESDKQKWTQEQCNQIADAMMATGKYQNVVIEAKGQWPDTGEEMENWADWWPQWADPRIKFDEVGAIETFSKADQTYKKGEVEYSYYQTKGIVVSGVPEVEFGFYCKTTATDSNNPEGKDGLTYFSEAHLNPYQIDYIGNNDGEKVKVKDSEGNPYKYDAPYAATFTRADLTDIVSTYPRVCFEDWPATGGEDMDLNDMIFYIGGNVTVVEEEKPWEPDPEPDPDPDPDPTPEWQWIIACEDLGTNDFDFNDVVFSVSAVTTEGEGDDMKSYVKVKALASGGTLPVYIYFEKDGVRNRIIPEGTDGEFHKWFGSHPSNKVINASSFRAEGTTVRIEVPNGFTMACNEKDNMGGFAVGVIYPDKEEIIEASSPGTINSNKNPELIGKAPQMICVPYSWYWPTENTFIVDVYEGFTGWCQDPENNGHWHKNPKGNYWQ